MRPLMTPLTNDSGDDSGDGSAPPVPAGARPRRLKTASEGQILNVFRVVLDERGGVVNAKNVKLEDMTTLNYLDIPRAAKNDANHFPSFPRGWAKRKGRNNEYERMPFNDYEQDLTQLFERYEVSAGTKISAGELLGHLEKMHPTAVDLPTLSEVNQLHLRLVNRKKSNRATTTTTTAAAAAAARGYRDTTIPPYYADYIKKLVEDDNLIKPAMALRLFNDKFPPGDPNAPKDRPSDQTFLNKINRLKGAKKREKREEK